MLKNIYIILVICLSITSISSANKIIISNSSTLKGVNIQTYTIKGSNSIFNVLNIAESSFFNSNGIVSWNEFEAFDIDQAGVYINNEIVNKSNVVQGNTIYGSLNNYADTIVINITTPKSITNINGAVNILGKQANLIVQNLNGTINCNTCSFGNVRDLDLKSTILFINNLNIQDSINRFSLDAGNIVGVFLNIKAKEVDIQTNLKFGMIGSYVDLSNVYLETQQINITADKLLISKNNLISNKLSIKNGDINIENTTINTKEFLVNTMGMLSFGLGNYLVGVKEIDFKAYNGFFANQVTYKNINSNLSFNITAKDINIETNNSNNMSFVSANLTALGSIKITSNTLLNFEYAKLQATNIDIKSKGIEFSSTELKALDGIYIDNKGKYSKKNNTTISAPKVKINK